MTSKIIVTGPIHGRFREVFGKISKLHEKNSFSIAIVVGDLFADPSEATSEDEENVDSLLNGKILVPLPTYFTVGRHPLPPSVIKKLELSDGEATTNLYFWNKRSTNKTSEGLRIVNLAGTLDPAITVGLSKDRFLPFYTEDDANSLRGANWADILITNDWPLSITHGSQIKVPDEITTPQGQQGVADLCQDLKPRYHFTSSDQLFYEREPYFHTSEEGKPDTTKITRFISLAAFGNPDKQKWLYAFNIDPKATTPAAMPSGTTACPLTWSRKRQRARDEIEANYRYSHHETAARPHKRVRRRDPPPTPRECFFCLSNPTIATHLIASIADDTYLATAKGPLTTSSSFPSLPCPAHMLIIPLSHAPTLAAIPDPKARASTYKEMQLYRRSLHNLLIDKCKDTMGAVTWEVSRSNGVHIHWQFLPVAASLIKQGLVEAAFRVEAENSDYPPFTTSKAINSAPNPTEDHFRLWIWHPKPGARIDPALANHHTNSSPTNIPTTTTTTFTSSPLTTSTSTITPALPTITTTTSSSALKDESSDDESSSSPSTEKLILLPLAPDARFDVQFGRRVMAKLLRLEARMDWRDCAQTEDEERVDAEAFKEGFKRWDFSREED